MTRTHPDLPWCRYADDGLVHCRSELEAEALKVELQARLAECGLEMHPTKTKIVYCKDGKRQGRTRTSRLTSLGTASDRELVRVLGTTIVLRLHPRGQPLGAESHAIDDPGLEHPATDPVSLDDIARKLNPLLRGWIGYYGRYNRAALETCSARQSDVLGWAMRKFKRFQGA